MSLVILGCVIYGSMFFYFTGENRKRERGGRDAIMEGLDENEILALGDENPRFRFAR
jgi:hypothetical protein